MTRVWRCGNRGNVASVLIEKPARGDFLPILDGGFSLQYSPLMEYREGKGMVLFCQMDVTGRTESRPGRRDAGAEHPPVRVGLEAGAGPQSLLRRRPRRQESSRSGRVQLGNWTHRRWTKFWLSAPAASSHRAAMCLALGLDEPGMKKAEHIAAYFEPFSLRSPFAGIGPADVHNRNPLVLPLVAGDATVVGDGVLAQAGNVVFCQLVPWQFDYRKQFNVKRTYRRTSFLVTRLLANMGVASATPLLERFQKPVAQGEQRWLTGLYLDKPEEMDDPYRFFRW